MLRKLVLRISLVCLSLLILKNSSGAQPKILQNLRKIQPYENYVVINWNSNSGLPQNSVNKICSDKNGVIWFATYGGLVRFDGTKFKVYSCKNYPELISDRIISLFIDDKNQVWLSNESGKLLVFDGKIFHDISHKLKQRFIVANNFGGDTKGNIYIKSDSTLFYYSNGKFETVPFTINGKSISRLQLFDLGQNSGSDTLIVSHPGRLSLVYLGKCLKTVDIPRQNGASFSMLKNQEGYWFINDSQLFFSKMFDAIPQAKPMFPGIKFAKIYSSGSTILAATIDQGIFKINKNLTIEKLFSAEQIHTSRQATLFIDSPGNWWIGTELNGLYYIKKKFLYTLDRSYGLGVTNTYPILKASDGTIWIGQNPGLLKIQNGKLTYMASEKINFNAVVWGLAEDKDKNLWIATNGTGLFRIKGNSLEDLTPIVAKATGYNFFSIYKDSQNRIWTGSVGAVACYENGKFTFFVPLNDKRNIYRNILEDNKGTLWFASDNGLISYSNGEFKLINSIDAKSARTLYRDRKNRMWIGTYGNGLYVKINNKFVSLTSKQGLFSDIISAVAEDFRGNYWFTCNNGIFRIRETEIDDFLSGKTNSVTPVGYGNEEGLENIEFNGGCQPSWMRDNEGNLWFPSFSGPVIVDVNSLRNPTRSPQVLIESLVYKNRYYYPGEKIVLPSDYTSFTVNLVAPSFSSPSNVRFRYRLLGNNDEWIEIGNKREIIFQKLPYGEYELQVLVADCYGNWSTVPASIKFSVESRFFETPIFYVLLTLSASSIFVYFLFLRLKIAKKSQEKLKKIVEDRTRSLQNAKEEAERSANEEKILRAKAEEENRQKIELLRIVSHDLKSPVSAIQGFTEMLIEDGALNPEDKDIVEMIGEASERMVELITQLLNFSRFEDGNFQIIKSKMNVLEEVDKIAERQKSHAAKKQQRITKDYKTFGCCILADTVLFSQVVENLITNAIKYSQPGKEIIVKLEESEENISICVKDFGQGFTEQDKANLYKPFVKLSSTPTAGELSSGLGLAIVKKFVELNEGTIRLESQKGTGSEFAVEFKKC